MTASEFLSEARSAFDRCLTILAKKNKDYAGVTATDPFANFRIAPAVLTGITTEKAILVRITDKLKRLDNLLSQDAFVTEESFDDTCDDLINYALILKLLRKDNHALRTAPPVARPNLRSVDTPHGTRNHAAAGGELPHGASEA